MNVKLSDLLRLTPKEVFAIYEQKYKREMYEMREGINRNNPDVIEDAVRLNVDRDRLRKLLGVKR